MAGGDDGASAAEFRRRPRLFSQAAPHVSMCGPPSIHEPAVPPTTMQWFPEAQRKAVTRGCRAARDNNANSSAK